MAANGAQAAADSKGYMDASLEVAKIAGITDMTTAETVHQQKRLKDDPTVPMDAGRIQTAADKLNVSVQTITDFEATFTARFPRFAIGGAGRRPSPQKVEATLGRVAASRTIKADAHHSKLFANMIASTNDFARYELRTTHNSAVGDGPRDLKMKRKDVETFTMQAMIRGLAREQE